MGEFTINTEGVPFNLRYTLESGQSFRWQEKGEWWVGVMSGGVVKLKQEGAALVCVTSSDALNSHAVYDYLGLGSDLERILASIMKDGTITEAVQKFYGLRLMKQEVWECLVSFAIATNSNIPRIRGMVSNLCDRLGDRVEFEGTVHSLFPTADRVAQAELPDLVACGLGYRAKFVKSIAESVSLGRVNLDELRLHDYAKARELLIEDLPGRKTLMGIGPKVADCVLLFSCDKDSAFPIDVWIARVLDGYYPHLFDGDLKERLASTVSGKTSLSLATYDRLSASARAYFGVFAGYAQQYLFHYERMRD
ncbi:MAG: DNA glycosylase [Nitrososphaerales archaeon]|jgi:N-glycosylase/DNA lyase